MCIGFDECGVYLWFIVYLLVNRYEYVYNDICFILFWDVYFSFSCNSVNI